MSSSVKSNGKKGAVKKVNRNTSGGNKEKKITAQQSIPYREMGKDGICRVEDGYYSKTIRFYDINYQLAQNEDKNAIFENWCDFLNYFDSTIHFQLSFINHHSNMAEYEDVIRIKKQNDSFDDLRMEFAQMLRNQLAKGNNGLVRTKYLTFGIEADNIREAKPKLERIETDILNNFKVLGVLIMHDTAEYTDEKEIVDQKAIELAKDFSYEGYQVVRRELFAHLREPAVVIRRDSVTFNTACIAGLEDAVYIQILVNQDNKRMVVRKCEENDKDALRWCVAKPDKRKSRKMTNKIFSAMMYEMMGWNLDCRYKILGHKITFEDETIYVFDLMETEIFMDIKGKRAKKDTESQTTIENANNIEETASSDTDTECSAEEIKRKNRIPFYPKEWKDSFGLPVEEHRKALEINMLDGYAEFTTGK